MTKFRKQFFSALASGALLLNIVTPVAAETNLIISGNGANTQNEAEVELETTKTVVQSNNAVVTNVINADATTGGNDANYNTGGSVTVWTGNAMTDVDVTNMLNKNVVSLDCCVPGDVDILIEGNGYGSENEAEFEKEEDTEVYQDNFAVVTNTVDADAKTGYNDANWNTGGDVVIRTGTDGNGGAQSTVSLFTAANWNSAVVGGGEGGDGEVSLIVADNGAYSENEAEVELKRNLLLVQNNLAVVTNVVDADAKTGGNEASWNTGGETAILTGNAWTDISVDNLLNFNAADLDCGCLLDDIFGKIEGNGYEADSEIEVELEEEVEVFQGGREGGGNEAVLTNVLDGFSKTGYNDAGYNTGDPEGDPFILTGNAGSFTDVSNVANMNVYGDFGLEFDWDLGWLEAIL